MPSSHSLDKFAEIHSKDRTVRTISSTAKTKMSQIRILVLFSCITTGVYVFIWCVGIDGRKTLEMSADFTDRQPCSNSTGESHFLSSQLSSQLRDLRPLDRNRAMNITVDTSKTKTIYIWYRPEWLFSNFGSTVADFKRSGCPVHNCRLVDAKNYPASKINKADSILFTIRDFFEKEKPQRTSREQIWVMWHNEAPLHDHPIEFHELNDYFNLTYSYLDIPDTDIYRPMGTIIPRPSNLIYRPPTREYIRSKTGLVAWIVSNCKSKGQRNEYVKEISRFLPVDIYGRCGMNCSREDDYCFKKVTKEYKFYLSFESLYCEYYMTEKVYRPLSGFIVPVVLGGANYSAVLPPHSFIDVRDFNSPEHLAKYLRYLDANDDEYVEYFKWKEKYMAVSRMMPGLCDLCEILHTPNYPYKSNFRFDQYWDPGKYCKVGKEERIALHLE